MRKRPCLPRKLKETLQNLPLNQDRVLHKLRMETHKRKSAILKQKSKIKKKVIKKIVKFLFRNSSSLDLRQAHLDQINKLNKDLTMKLLKQLSGPLKLMPLR